MQIATFSPSSKPDENLLKKAILNLESRGIKVELSPNLLGRRGLDVSSDKERFNDFKWAFFESRSTILIPSRGGYGLSRILDEIVKLNFAKVKKTLIGFSDLTFVLNFLSVFENFDIFHGPMLATNFFAGGDELFHYLEKVVNKVSYEIRWEGYSSGGRFSGKIYGGNLTCFSFLVNTNFLPHIQDFILFLEEYNEEEYRVDRMLHFLKYSGIFREVKGVIVGFSDVGYDVYINFFRKNKIPFSTNFPGGHGKMNLPFPIGRVCEFDADRNVLRVHFER
ncbi:MAG: LD-carboxypeptidase [bacterium]|nr:LD-carboxypeptidase [bacterium]